LAEKSTIDGIKKFYSNLEPYLRANLAEKYNPETACTCNGFIESEGYREIYDEIIPITIENLWEQIYCVIPGNINDKHITKEKWTDVKYEPWRTRDEPDDKMIEADKCFGLKFRPTYEKLDDLYHQRIHHTIPNTDPKLPCSVATKTQNLVTKKSMGSLCVHTNSHQPDLGSVSDVKICLKTTNGGVRVSVIGLLSFVKGNMAVEKSVIERNVYTKMASYYQSLFDNFLPKDEIIIKKSWADQVDEFVDQLKKKPEIILAVLFLIMLFMYSIVLWNLLDATQRLQAQIGELKLELIRK
jgi:hypothetical protein